MHRLATKPVTNKGFHLVVITNICMHKMGRQLEGYVEGVQWSQYGYVSVVSCL